MTYADTIIQESTFCKFESFLRSQRVLLVINLLSGNPERYSGRLLCTKNGNPD